MLNAVANYTTSFGIIAKFALAYGVGNFAGKTIATKILAHRIGDALDEDLPQNTKKLVVLSIKIEMLAHLTIGILASAYFLDYLEIRSFIYIVAPSLCGLFFGAIKEAERTKTQLSTTLNETSRELEESIATINGILEGTDIILEGRIQQMRALPDNQKKNNLAATAA